MFVFKNQKKIYIYILFTKFKPHAMSATAFLYLERTRF